MLHPRIIPCLLIHNSGLVKTEKFRSPKYVGDPINAVRIFNEKEVDELVIVDIDATVKNREPNYALIEKLASECRMPLCYGGGIKSVEQAIKIFNLGVEKIALSSAALDNPKLISEIAGEVGTQSVVVVLDVKKKIFGGYEIYTHNATKKRKLSIDDALELLLSKGVGEIVINSIDNDGLCKGYDTDLIDKVNKQINIPMTALGGCGSINDIEELFDKFGIIGAAAGSYFVFKGKYKAVLISYPSVEDKQKIIQKRIKSD
ncbi:imidazole glycerol phosphate synthase cyclase subunit [Francisella sp. W12-1067]|nr:imidazole glycerol phosphate synthase cyclase subunit [Francisella sp. W12-1067]